MPCRWSRRCGAADSEMAVTITETLPKPSTAAEIDSWRKVRFQYIRALRKHTKYVLLLMAMIEALKHGPLQLVYAGRDDFPAPGPEDYGIAYTVGYLLSYIYVCVFMIIFVPLFSWWLPQSSSHPDQPSFTRQLAEFLKKVNLILLPISIVVSLVSYLVTLAQVFIYVDSRQAGLRTLPKNTRKNWVVRVMLICGILTTLSFGYGAFQVLEMTDLAHVKAVEYLIIVVPIQINLGILLGTKMQMKMEKRIAMKKRMCNKLTELEASPAIRVVDEKAPLIDV